MKDKKETKKKTSFKEVVIESEKEPVVDDEKDFGLHPSELADEVSRSQQPKEPEEDLDVKVQSKELPEPEVREEEKKPAMITIKEVEEKLRPVVLRCPFDNNLDCADCRLYQRFLGTESEKVCSIVRVAHQMPL